MKTDFTFLEMQRSKLITANIKIDSCINWESFDWKLKRLKPIIRFLPGQLEWPPCFVQQQWEGVVPMSFIITPGFGDSSQVIHIKIQKYKNTKLHTPFSSMFSILYPTFLDVSMGSKWMMHLILWLSSFKFQLQASFQWLGWST